MKKALLFIAIVIVIAGGVSGFVKNKNKNNTKETAKVEENQLADDGTATGASTIQSTPGSDIILFYGKGCPHCVKVEEFIKTNKIDEKAQLDVKEVWYNDDNNKELTAKAEICKIPQDDLGVPFLFDKKTSKCFIGNDEITAFLKQLAGIN